MLSKHTAKNTERRNNDTDHRGSLQAALFHIGKNLPKSPVDFLFNIIVKTYFFLNNANIHKNMSECDKI